MKKIFNAIAYVTLIFTAILVTHALYLTYYPFQVVTLYKFLTTKNVVNRGEMLPFVLEFKKSNDFRGEIKYYLVDGIIVRLEDGGTKRNIGEHEVRNEKIIPTTILPGVYKFRIELLYNITPWRDILYTWESNEFTVK